MKMLLTCVSTVFGLRKSRPQIPRFERPSAISAEHLALARGQLGERIVLPAAAEELRDHVRVDRRPAASDAPHCLEEVVDLEHAVLEEVAEALRALAEERERVCAPRRSATGAGRRPPGAPPGSRVPRAPPRRCASAACGRRRPRRPGLRRRTASRSSSAFVALGEDFEAAFGEDARRGPRGAERSPRRSRRAWDLPDDARAAAGGLLDPEPAALRLDPVGEAAEAGAAVARRRRPRRRQTSITSFPSRARPDEIDACERRRAWRRS